MRGGGLIVPEGSATGSVSDKPGIRTQASGPFHWSLGSAEETSKHREASGCVGLLGYLCWDRNKALQRPSCKCSSKEAQERKESSEKNKRELAPPQKKKKKEKEGEGMVRPVFTLWDQHALRLHEEHSQE